MGKMLNSTDRRILENKANMILAEAREVVQNGAPFCKDRQSLMLCKKSNCESLEVHKRIANARKILFRLNQGAALDIRNNRVGFMRENYRDLRNPTISSRYIIGGSLALVRAGDSNALQDVEIDALQLIELNDHLDISNAHSIKEVSATIEWMDTELGDAGEMILNHVKSRNPLTLLDNTCSLILVDMGEMSYIVDVHNIVGDIDMYERRLKQYKVCHKKLTTNDLYKKIASFVKEYGKCSSEKDLN